MESTIDIIVCLLLNKNHSSFVLFSSGLKKDIILNQMWSSFLLAYHALLQYAWQWLLQNILFSALLIIIFLVEKWSQT